MSKVVFLITARLKSKRLKKKIIRKVNGIPLIIHMVNRIKKSKTFNSANIIVCTSFKKGDKHLVTLCKKNNIKVFLGDPIDVLKRLYDASKKFKAKYIVNITADCPLVEPEYIDQTANLIKNKNYDFIRSYDLPHGSFCYGINVESLKKVLLIKNSNETEVWERYFIDTGYFNVHDMKIKNKLHIKPGLRLTLDYKEDLILIKKIFKHFKNYNFFSLGDILDLFSKNKKLIEINKKYTKKFISHYKKNLFLNLKKDIDYVKQFPKKLGFIQYIKKKGKYAI